MKIDWATVVTVLIAMVLWKLLIDPLTEKILPNGVMGNFEEDSE